MYCKYCGNYLTDDCVFCNQCGKKVERETHAEKETPVAPLSELPQADVTTNTTEVSVGEIVVDEMDTEEMVTDATDADTTNTDKKKKFEKLFHILGWIGLGLAGLGAAIYLGIILIGIFVYGKVYLFDGYDFTKVLAILGIIFMLTGVACILAKVIGALVLKIGRIPASKLLRIVAIALVIISLGFSVYGFVNCSGERGKSSGSSSSSNSSDGGYYETTVSKYLGLQVSVTSTKTSGNYTYVYCQITNVSSNYGTPTKYRYVKVKAVFKNRSGTIVDTDWTYAIDGTWLDPGETKTFYYMVRDTSVKTATLSIE